MLVGEAVHSLTRRGLAATVNAITHEIGIDQSGASRLVKSATAAGYLIMASASDGRQREASLTPAGQSMLAQAHRWQEDVFGQLIMGWSEKRRRDFQQAMVDDLVGRSYALGA